MGSNCQRWTRSEYYHAVIVARRVSLQSDDVCQQQLADCGVSYRLGDPKWMGRGQKSL